VHLNTAQILFLAPTLVAAAACMAGVLRAEADRPDWTPVVAGLVFSLVIGAIVFTWRDSEVAGSDVLAGVLIGASMLGACPVWLYFALGRALVGHRGVLAALFVASLVPLYLYCILVLLLAIDLVGCPEDAYECPL
jgi:hypothetical protein